MHRGFAMTGRRWDTDTRGRGIADARSALPSIERLAQAMASAGWVAEEAEAHLLPHLQAAAQSLGIEIRSTDSVDGAFELELARPSGSQAELRSQVMTLVGSIAEASTHVRQVGEIEFEVVTGMLPGDSPVFTAHGHLLRIRFV